MLTRLFIDYEDQDQLRIETTDFATMDELKERLILDPSKKLVIHEGANGILVRKDFIKATAQEIIDGNVVHEEVWTRNASVITAETVMSSEASEEIIDVPSPDASTLKELEKQEIMPEETPVYEPEYIAPESENLPEIPTKFKSFRDFFMEENRQCNSFLNSIAEKMAKRKEVLRAFDEELNKENDFVEEMRQKFVKK